MHYVPAEKGDFMTFRTVLLASAIGLCSVATAVWADPPIGSRLGDRTAKDPEKRERESALGAHEMARCLANKQGGVVRSYLGSLDEAESQRLDRKMDGEHECFSMAEGNDLVEGRVVTFPHDIFRGMLAEWMIKKDERTFAALPALPRQLTYSRPWYALSGRDSSVDEMATCVSETAPVETLALLKTLPYSPDEGAAFGGLGPSLGACLRAGIKVSGNRQSLRAALADALYQRVANPPVVPNEPAKR
jgi:hypothetical protein